MKTKDLQHHDILYTINMKLILLTIIFMVSCNIPSKDVPVINSANIDKAISYYGRKDSLDVIAKNYASDKLNDCLSGKNTLIDSNSEKQLLEKVSLIDSGIKIESQSEEIVNKFK